MYAHHVDFFLVNSISNMFQLNQEPLLNVHQVILNVVRVIYQIHQQLMYPIRKKYSDYVSTCT